MDVLNNHWVSRILGLAKTVASWSKDRSTKVGAVITSPDGRPISWGFNGFPMGVDDNDDSRHQRPVKYQYTCHAEKNALDLAPGPVSGGVMFVTLSPCTGCARSIIQRRISTVVVDHAGSVDHCPDHWKEDLILARSMMLEAGVKYIVSEAGDAQ